MTRMLLHLMMGVVYSLRHGKFMQVTMLPPSSVKGYVAGQAYTGVDLPLAPQTD